MLSIWIVESKSKGPGLTRAVLTRQAGPRPTCAVSVVNGRSPICPRLALPVDRRGRPLGRRRQAAPSRRHGRQPGRRRGRMSGPSREAAGSPRAWRQQPHPTAVTGEEGGGRHVEAGDRLETGGRRALVVLIRTLQNLDGKTPIDVAKLNNQDRTTSSTCS